MVKLTQRQEDLLFEMVDHMVRCDQSSFWTRPGDDQLTIFYDPPHLRDAACDQSLVLDDAEEGSLKLIGSEYLALVQAQGNGYYKGTLTGKAESEYSHLLRVRILKMLKRLKDEHPSDYKLLEVEPEHFGTVYSSFYDDSLQLLLNDGSIADNGVAGIGGVRGLYITPRGESRVRGGIYDLSRQPEPHVIAANAPSTQNNITGTQSNVGGNQYNIQAGAAAPKLSRRARELFCLIAEPLMNGAPSFGILPSGDKMLFRFRGGGQFEQETYYKTAFTELVNAGYLIAPTDRGSDGGLTGRGEELYEQLCSKQGEA